MSLAGKRRFVARLELAIKEHGGYITAKAPRGIGPLARALDPDNHDRGERNLHRWLDRTDPTLPRAAARASLARALGKDADFFDPRPTIDSASAAHIAYMRKLVTASKKKARERMWDWAS